MILPVKDWEKWYSAQKFGEKTSYGYHGGEDLNLKTGGDTDLGQPILAIASGEVTSAHSHTGSSGWGKHLHIAHEGPWGKVWCHFAHCQEILVKEGDKVSEGQIVAKLGKTGTQYAHLHWEIKLQPTGVDAVAKTIDDLKKWTAPIDFVLEWSRKTGGNMDWLTEYFRVNFDIDLRADEGSLRGQLQYLIDAVKRYETAETNAEKYRNELEASVQEAALWEERYNQAIRDREQVEKELLEKNGIIKDRDQTIHELTSKLKDVEGKVCIPEEEYERLSSKETLKRFTRLQLLWEAIKPRR